MINFMSRIILIQIISCLILFFEGNNSTVAQENLSPDTLFISPDTIYNELDEVVITGTRVSKKIIDIPYSVVRLNFTDYQYDRKASASDILPAVPGLFLQSRYGNHDVRFSIRGFGSRSNSGIRGIRILLDDIPESEPDGQTRIEAIDFNSIGRIEIVKGNASSLYTNAPGGVANFINDISFHRSSIRQLNQFGSFGLYRNGFKAAVRTDNYGLLTTYSYQNYDGYREHNGEYWHILNMVLETNPSDNTSLKVLGYFVDGLIKLPGSLTGEEFAEDPWQADQRSVDRDLKRASTKGRLGLRFKATIGDSLNHHVEVTAYGTIKSFERTSGQYRIINRNGFGLSARYTNTYRIAKRRNEFTIGADLLSQPARIEYYDNIGGTKGDQILQLQAESLDNIGFYFSDNFEIVKNKLFMLLTGRYDNVSYHIAEETLPSRNESKTFSAFTPKMALNYKLNPWVSLYTSFGYSFDSPAKNEMDSPDPGYIYNTEIKPQESRNFEIGIKGNRLKSEQDAFRKILFEATFFNINVINEIVPFEVFQEVYFRNAAESHRFGLEMGTIMEITRGLNLNVSYTYSRFKYKAYQAATIEIDTAGNIIETDRDFSGNVVPSIPEHNLYASLSYSKVIFRNLNGFVKGSYMGIGGMWVDDANTEKTDGYNLVNAVLGFEMKFGGFNMLVSGGLNNIFDELYVGFTNTNSASKQFYEAGAPRNWFLTVNFGYTF
jgi:iron complex outermembrane receptor protein